MYFTLCNKFFMIDVENNNLAIRDVSLSHVCWFIIFIVYDISFSCYTVATILITMAYTISWPYINQIGNCLTDPYKPKMWIVKMSCMKFKRQKDNNFKTSRHYNYLWKSVSNPIERSNMSCCLCIFFSSREIF